MKLVNVEFKVIVTILLVVFSIVYTGEPDGVIQETSIFENVETVPYKDSKFKTEEGVFSLSRVVIGAYPD